MKYTFKFSFLTLLLLALGGQLFGQKKTIAYQIDCPQADCGGAKLTKIKQITTIKPPDLLLATQLAWNTVGGAEAMGFPGNTSFRLNFGWAPSKTISTPIEIVPSERYAKANGLDQGALLQDEIVVRSAKTPYWEGGIQFTQLSFASLSQISSGRTFELRYLDLIPLGFRYELGQRFSVGAGASFSLLLNATADGREILDPAASGYNEVEPGLLFNLQFGKRGKGLQAGINQNLRFAQLNGSNLRYGVTQFYVGWGFGKTDR